ncbi:MAG TPA: efflux RND transporter permease subunit [Terrimicrobiaceae bacterium]
MWIVDLALRRPLTFIVLAIFILISGVLCIIKTPKDIFPNIDIPVVSVIFNYAGMSPDQVEAHITSPYERVLTTTVDDIQHIESQSLYGIVVIKVFMQPTASLPKAVAQITAISQTILRQLPTGTTPPLIISYTASNVPVIRVGLGGKSLSEQRLNDLALNVVRIQLITIPGASVPYPYGGKMRYVSVDLNYQALQAHGLVPADVINAISAQNLILPSGTAKIGRYEYQVGLNSSPLELSELNSIPIKTLPNGTTLYVRDVANVRSGNIPQTNIVRFNGSRGTMLDVQKTGTASTLDIVKGVRDRLPLIQQILPDGAEISLLADQSIFVTGAISGVVREGIIAACLTAIMILVFLGDWKSTLIIAISIPLSILASISILSAIGQTINIMTLGGLALAVGILVDDATVTIENIDRHLAEGKSVIDGIRDGAAQIAIPAFVSTLCICIVFVPIFFLSGVAKYLFIPLAQAVIFAMLASYILSRTLVPTLAMYWIKGHSEAGEAKGGFFLFSWASAFQRGFERRFERFREDYRDLLSMCLSNGRKVIFLVMGFVLASCLLFPFLGQDFFPAVDAGRFDMHVRMKSGTRIEETARTVDEIEQMIRKIIPADQLGEIIDNLGLPYSGINTSYNNTGTVSPADGDILVSLQKGHDPTNDFVRKIRLEVRKQFPDVTVWFPPADIVAQILNFGLSAPIDVQVVGSDRDEIFAFASKLLGNLRKVPGLVDLRIQEPNDTPRLDVTVDRTKASILGLTEQSVANSLLGALSGSQQVSPNFWVDPKNGITYQLNAMVPQYDINSPGSLMNLPVLGSTTGQNQILANVASISRSQTSPVMDRFNIRPAINVFGGVDGRDLGAVARDVQNAIDALKKELPRGSVITLRGQVSTMQDSFLGLYVGLVFSMLLVYLLMVVNFQSWSEPLIIITALPVALAGIMWMLFITETTLSVPALMGAIMCMGVATANSVLVITFANERFEETHDSYLAALEAGYTRIRPVLMTAGAMIIGMFPMALGFGEGGEQNAPLGRAVIGGLIFATAATLFFVPTVFRLVRKRKPSTSKMPQALKS